MTLTKKHFEAVEKIIDKCYAPTTEAEQLKINIVNELSEYFKTQNSNFDRELFLFRCGVDNK